MKQNKFDLVMDYIDANISQDVETIKKGIFNLIGYNSNTFGNCFQILTDKTLFHYVNERKMYFAAQSLRNDIDRSIADIALDWNYSDQSAFSRAFKSYCGGSPFEVRKGILTVFDNKPNLAALCTNRTDDDNRFKRIFQEFEETGDVSMASLEYLEDLEEASRETSFDIDTCAAISDLAERLEIPFWWLLGSCKDLVLEIKENPDYLPPRIEKAIDCGISSGEELDAICNYYNCKYYDLDRFMVDCYREHLKLE